MASLFVIGDAVDAEIWKRLDVHSPLFWSSALAWCWEQCPPPQLQVWQSNWSLGLHQNLL